MSSPESRVERLNYVNGRRLDAADLQLEQDYLVGMRRRLNHGLFTPGVVMGLAIIGEAASDHVTVQPGLALDATGAEMVVLEAVELAVPNILPSNGIGHFLVLWYDEEGPPGEDPDCGPPSREAARIVEQPRLEWTQQLPDPRLLGTSLATRLDAGVVLGLVTVDADCEIETVEITLRQLSSPRNASKASAYVLEGEKDIDSANSKVLHFQIRGGAPSEVLLSLWGGQFSTLFYTEMGAHTHRYVDKEGNATTETGTAPNTVEPHTHEIVSHRHAVGGIKTGGGTSHTHRLSVEAAHIQADRGWGKFVLLERAAGDGAGFALAGRVPGANWPQLIQAESDHTHTTVSGATTGLATAADGTVALTGLAKPVTGAVPHPHQLPAIADVGSPDLRARSGVSALAYLNRLQVKLNGHDLTGQICAARLWNEIGDGTDGHELNTSSGTGPIDLIDIARAEGIAINEGDNTLEFSVASGGGKVLWNLVIE